MKGHLHYLLVILLQKNRLQKEPEDTIFRKGFSSIDERFSFLIASSTSKPITSIVVLCPTFTVQLFVLLDHMSGLPIFYMASGWYEDWHSVCEISGFCFQVKCMPN